MGDNANAPELSGGRPDATAPRLAKMDVSQLTEQQLDLYRAITGGPRAAGPQLFALTDAAGRLEGPFNAMLLSPSVGEALQKLGAAVRYGSALPDRSREIAILVVAHHWRSDFEIYAHEAVGRAAGLTAAELTAIADKQYDVFADDVERSIATIAEALASRSDLDDDSYQAAVDVLGQQQLFELTTLVGYYATLALQLRIFRVPSPG